MHIFLAANVEVSQIWRVIAMDEETLNFYIQKIEEFVLDDGKIVTYKWLSKTLGVHVNIAKQLLYTFATESNEAKKVGIVKTHFISGMLSDNSGWKVIVVNEDKLEKAKLLFKFLTSNHIYSVQKAKRSADICSFYEIDRFRKDESDKVIPAITCTSAIPRSEVDISSLRFKAVPAIPENDKPSSTTAKKPSPGIKMDLVDGKKTKEEKEEVTPVTKKPNTPATNGNVKKSGSIAAMFATQQNKIKSTENVTQPKQIKGKNGKVSEFFCNSKKNIDNTGNDNNSAVHETSLPAPEENIKKEDGATLELSKNKSTSKLSPENSRQKNSDSSLDKNSRTSKEQRAKEKPKKQGKLNKKSKIKEESDVGKKRKRIMTLESDSDEDIFEDEEMPESPPPPEQEPPPEEMECEDVIPCTPLPKPKPGRKHKRTLKDKTFMDEEGYLITKKEYVFESCSDSDTEKENELKVAEKVGVTREVTNSKGEGVEKSSTEDASKTKTEEAAKRKSGDLAKSKSKGATKKKDDKTKGSQKSKQSSLLNFFKQS